MIQRKFLIPLVSFSILALSACEPTSQDAGSSAKVAINGITQDGFVSGGVIWHDANDNKTLDSGEPYAETDQEGYFTKSRTGTDYCRDGASATEQRYCLKINAPTGVASPATLRLQGGTDIITGEPFVGQISLTAKIDSNGNISSVVSTPITSMLSHMSSQQITQFAEREQVTEAFLGADFLDFVFTGASLDPANADNAKQIKFIKAALQVHKTVELANTLLKQRYTIIGDPGVPSDASDFVYQAITQSFVALPLKDTTGAYITLSKFMEGTGEGGLNTNTLRFIFEKAESALVTAIKDAGKVQGTDAGFPSGTVDSTLWTDLANNALLTTKDISTAMDASVDGGAGATATINKNQMFARAKAVEVIKETIKKKIEAITYNDNGTLATGSSVSDLNSIPAFTNARNLVTAANIATVLTADQNLDIAAVVDEYVKTNDGVTTVSDNTVLTQTAFRDNLAKLFIEDANNAGSFTTTLANKEIILETKTADNKGAIDVPDPLPTNADGTYNTTDTAGKFGKSRLVFSANSNTAASGDLIICTLYNDGKDTINTAETDGFFIGGTWQRLDDFKVELRVKLGSDNRTFVLKSLKYDNTTSATDITRTFAHNLQDKDTFEEFSVTFTTPTGDDKTGLTQTDLGTTGKPAFPTNSDGCKAAGVLVGTATTAN